MKKIIAVLLIAVFSSSVILAADYGQIKVTVTPTMENIVYLDFMSVGSAPITIDKIESGSHLLEVVADRRTIYKQEVEVLKNKVLPVKINVTIAQPLEQTTITEAVEAPASTQVVILVSAEPRVRRLVEKERASREQTGNIIIGLGAAIALTALSEPSKSGTYLGSGLFYAGLGVWSKTLKSDFEVDYLALAQETDPTMRARLAENALARDAEKKKADRQSTAWIPLLYGGALTATGYGAIIGIPLMVTGWNRYNEKSETEKEYDAYLNEKGGGAR